MRTAHRHRRRHRRRRREQGISLFIVMVMVLLSSLLVAWATRTAYFSELVTGNDADYQRAFEAAQAMVRDAEFDIQGMKPDGTPCAAAHPGSCRELAIDTASLPPKIHFPQKAADLEALEIALGADAGKPSCLGGICTARNIPPEFWGRPDQFAAMKALGARYGQFTGAAAASVGNPLLAGGRDAARAKAWYWVEVLPYNYSGVLGGGPAYRMGPDRDNPVIYRITGIAEGLKAGTVAVVQSLYLLRSPED